MAVKTLNLSEELWEQLDMAAVLEGRSRSNMAARLLGDALSSSPRPVSSSSVVPAAGASAVVPAAGRSSGEVTPDWRGGKP